MFERIDEEEQLKYFRLAYRQVTGQMLLRVRKSERPDFICSRPDGTLVGVEFTLITRDPESSSWDEVIRNEQFMNGLDGIIDIAATISRKGEKLSGWNPSLEGWQLPHSSILVLSTPDCPISDVENYLDANMRSELVTECERSGFSEVWIADHTEVDAYGNIELFGLFPAKYWGSHPRPWSGKPYG